MASGKRPAVVIDLCDDDDDASTRGAGAVGSSQQRRRRRRAHAGARGGAAQSCVVDLSAEPDDSGGGSGAGAAAGGAKSRWARPKSAFTCPVCFCDTPPSEGAVLYGCSHPFCVECLEQYVRTKVASGEVLPEQLVCPCVEPERCAKPLAPADVKRCLRTPAEAARYERLTLLRAAETEADMGACPTPGCNYLFCWEEDNRKFECPLCHKSYCLVCRVMPWHAGRRCEEVAAEGGDSSAGELCFERFAKGEKLRQCPGCKAWVQKRGGCDAMHCRCNCVFCYTCGGTLEKTAKKTGAKKCSCGADTHDLLRQHEQSGVNHNLQPGMAGEGSDASDEEDDDYNPSGMSDEEESFEDDEGGWDGWF